MVDIIPLGSALVAGIFSATLLRQYLRRRRGYQLIWTVSMAFFAVGAFMEFVMSFVTVTGPLFDLYYVLVGPETGLLGAGVVYLLRPRIGKYVLYAVVVLSVCLVVAVLAWPVDISGVVTGQPGPAMTYEQWFQTSVVDGIYFSVSAFALVPRDLTQVLNYIGATLVIGGGLFSFAVDRRRIYALVIALGASMDAIGGILLGVYNEPDLFLYFEFLGIVLIFLGFLLSTRFVTKTTAVGQAPGAVPIVAFGGEESPLLPS